MKITNSYFLKFYILGKILNSLESEEKWAKIPQKYFFMQLVPRTEVVIEEWDCHGEDDQVRHQEQQHAEVPVKP